MRDFVVYDRETKEIYCIVKDFKEEPKYLINIDLCVAVWIDQADYTVKEEDGIGYFENLSEKIRYLDDYRGRYEE